MGQHPQLIEFYQQMINYFFVGRCISENTELLYIYLQEPTYWTDKICNHNLRQDLFYLLMIALF